MSGRRSTYRLLQDNGDAFILEEGEYGGKDHSHASDSDGEDGYGKSRRSGRGSFMLSSSVSDVEGINSSSNPSSSRGGADRFHKCCGLSYCMWYSIILVTLLSFGVCFCLLYFFIVPDIANERIDNALVVVDSATLSTINGGLHLKTTLNFTNVHIPFGLACRVTKSTLVWYYEGNEIGTATLGAQDISGTSFQLIIESGVTVTSMKTWEEFASAQLRKKGSVVTVIKSQSMHIHTSILGVTFVTPVNVDKEIAIEGLAGMKDVDVLGYDVTGTPDTSGFTVSVNAVFHNPSNVAVLNAGIIKAHLIFESESLATFSSNSTLNLLPGANDVLIVGTFFHSSESMALDNLFTLLLNYSGPPVPVNVVTDTAHATTNNFFRVALANLNVPTVIPPVNGSVTTEIVFPAPPTLKELEEWASIGGHLEFPGFIGFKIPFAATAAVHHLQAAYWSLDANGTFLEFATVDANIKKDTPWLIPGNQRWQSPLCNCSFDNFSGKQRFDIVKKFGELFEEGYILGSAVGGTVMKLGGVRINAKLSLPNIPVCLGHNEKTTCRKHFPHVYN